MARFRVLRGRKCSIPTPVTRVPDPSTLDQPPTTKSGHISSFLWKPEFSLIGSSSEIDRFTKRRHRIDKKRKKLVVYTSVCSNPISKSLEVPKTGGTVDTLSDKKSSFPSVFSISDSDLKLDDVFSDQIPGSYKDVDWKGTASNIGKDSRGGERPRGSIY
jgi:hypothetical protein